MSRGPAPTPQAILLARGSKRGKAREKQGVIEVESVTPDRPFYVEQDSQAKMIWDMVVPFVEDLGCAGRVDGIILGRYCVLFSRWLRAEAFLREREDDVYATHNPDGSVRALRPYPQVAIADKLMTQLVRVEREMGMTPAARSRVVQAALQPGLGTELPGNTQEDDDEEFLGHLK